MNLFDDFPEGVCRRNVPLAPLTWFKLGGPADCFIEPRSEDEFATVVRRCGETDTPLRMLGMGANVLVPDEGVRGVVIRLSSDEFTRSLVAGDSITVGGGMDMTKLVRDTVRRGLAGLEQLAGIPGTVGGGICMNCGGRYGEIASALLSIRVLGPDGLVRERMRSDLGFGYRTCQLGRDHVLSAVFGLRRTDPDALQRRFREIWSFKQASQPALGVQSAGCIFRNPTGRSAGQLIDQAGLKGFRIGSASISERHANFALADRGGRAVDVRRLISEVTDRVAEHCGVRLEPEVKIW